MIIPFFKYQGTGNDFVLVDNRTQKYESVLTQKQVAYICDRRFGIGADGLILLSPSEEADFRMIYYNSDGSESTMCGNGGRCIVAYAHRLGLIGKSCRFMAIDGPHEAYITEDQVRLKMGAPTGFKQLSAHSSQIDTGSPHYVKFLQENETSLEDLDVYEKGKAIRTSAPYAEQGINVNFVAIEGPSEINVRTYERGVEDETFSCGTGVTACVYAHMRMNGGESTVAIHTPGGDLTVEIIHAGADHEEVFLIGPATCVFAGEIEV